MPLHGLQHTTFPCPSLTPGVCSNSCPLSPWHHPIISPLCLSLLLFPSIRAFFSKSALCIRWPKYWSFSISLSNEYWGLISFRIDWFDLLAVQETLKSLLQHHSYQCSGAYNSYGPTLTSTQDHWKAQLWPYRLLLAKRPLLFTVLSSWSSEKATAPHSSTPAWKSPWTEGPGGLQSTGSLGVGRDWATSLLFLPGESRDGGAWRAAVYGVAQSQTRLKRLSSSSCSSLSQLSFHGTSVVVLISWLKSVSAMILESKKRKSVTVSTFPPSIYHAVMGPDAMILVFWMLSFKPAFSLSSFTLYFLPLYRYHLHMWGCWYFCWQSWFQLVIHSAQILHDILCTEVK